MKHLFEQKCYLPDYPDDAAKTAKLKRKAVVRKGTPRQRKVG